MNLSYYNPLLSLFLILFPFISLVTSQCPLDRWIRRVYVCSITSSIYLDQHHVYYTVLYHRWRNWCMESGNLLCFCFCFAFAFALLCPWRKLHHLRLAPTVPPFGTCCRNGYCSWIPVNSKTMINRYDVVYCICIQDFLREPKYWPGEIRLIWWSGQFMMHAPG